ncbi:MAG: DUF58 domain-containing protein [Rhodoferax sp.]|uniref:DUF58 domain-containing protein n=2 Tax=Rhodoferax sp. TaxID=50421 RepID=UPI00326694AA
MGQWFRASAAPAVTAPPALLNAGTWASSQDLIGLQPYAGAIGLQPTGAARARRAGEHASRFRGRGMDYRESRGYVAGDDVRSMDWRVTARSGIAHVKVYEEERERPVVLFLDLNPGMFFGSRRQLKSVVAARAAALFAWAAVGGGDRMGAVLSNGERCELQPRGGRHGALEVIRQVVKHTDPRIGIAAQADAGALNAALHRLCRVSRPGSLTILLGDFYGLDAQSDKLLLRLRRHGDVAAVQIVDPLEQQAPPAALYGVESRGQRTVLDTRSAAAQRAYTDYFGRHHEAVAAMMRRHGIPLVWLSTENDVATALRAHFPAGSFRPLARPWVQPSPARLAA